MPTVLIVAHHYLPHIGGLELVVQRQAQGLVKHGYQVRVLTSRWESHPSCEIEDEGVEVTRVPAWHIMENRFFIPFPLFSPRLVLDAWRQIRAAQVVHIHDVFYISSWISAALAKLARKPLLLTQHVAMVEHPSRFVMWVQRLVYATAGKFIFGSARQIVAYNRNVRDFLLSRGINEKKILWLTNGIDIEMFRPPAEGERATIRARYGLPPDRPLVLFVGRLVEKKGVQVLLDAKDRTFDLVFAGPGPIPDGGLVDGVHWLGPLDQARTAELYRCCDLFVFPAIGEIFTLAMQEAMASQLPVITTDDAAYMDNDLADGLTLCPREAHRLNEAIVALLSDSRQRLEMGLRCRQTALRHFNWDANFSSLKDAYAEVSAAG